MDAPITLTDKEMFHEIMEEVRHIRKRLDGHIDDERATLKQVHAEITTIKEEMAGHKSKLATIVSGISLVVAGIVAWIVSNVGMSE